MIANLTNFDKFKVMIIGAVSLMFLSVLAPLFQTSAQASQIDDIDNIELTAEEEEARVDEVAEQLEFIYEEASTKDSEGNITDIDLQMIQDKYGESEDLSEFIAFVEKQDQLRGSWTDCMLESIADFFGVASVGSLGASFMAALQGKKWTAVAKVLVSAFGAKVTVGTLAGTLAYYAGKCAF